MSADRVVDLREVSELRQTIAARPPAIVHGTAIVLSVLLVAAVGWAALTKANLVVRGAARVRPADAPLKSFDEVSNEEVFTEVGGRVVAIEVKDGQRVARGDVLVRLDTETVENDMARLGRELDAGQDELTAMDRMRELYDAQFQASQARAAAEIARASHEVHRSKERLRSDAKLADVELADALAEKAGAEDLVAHQAGALADVSAANARVERARERVAATQIGVDDGEPEVLRRGMEQAARDHDVKLADLDRERASKRGAIEAEKKQLANLELEKDRAVIRAHRDGVVTVGGLTAGDLVAPGKLPLAIVAEGALRVDAAVSTADVALLRVGMPVRVKLDAFDFQRYGSVPGVISYIAADTAIGAGPGGARVSYYLVSVSIERTTLELKTGMTGQIEVVTGRRTLLSLFVQSIRQAVSL
jgi:multidrug resistance efflux pump